MDSSRAHKIEGEVGLKEKWLQMYLAQHPEIIPTNDLDGMDTKLRLIGCELEEMDLLFADERGLLTIVEIKLSTNSELNRKVVAQIQDYAALLSHQTVFGLCKLIADLDGSKEIKDLDTLRNLSGLLSKIISNDESKESEKKAKDILAHYVVSGEVSDSPKPSPNEEQFLKKLDSMMGEGSFRLAIVTNKANIKLLDLLNYVSSTLRRGHQLVAFEFTVESIGENNYFIPHLIGHPGLLSAEYYRKDTISDSIKWDEETYFQQVNKKIKDPLQIENLHKLYQFSKDIPGVEIRWGRGQTSSFMVDLFKKIMPKRSWYHVSSDGRLVFNTDNMQEFPEIYKYRDEFKEKLSKMGLRVEDDYKKSSPSFSIKDWSLKVNEFIQAVRELVNSQA